MPLAIKPSHYSSFSEVIKQEQKVENIEEEGKHLSNLSNHKGWKILDEYINNLIKDLDEVASQAIASGQTYEEIGRNAIVLSLVKDIVSKIRNKVNDAKEANED